MKRALSHPTLLIPGIAGGMPSMMPLRWFLRSRGIDARIWPAPIILAYPVRYYGKRVGKIIGSHALAEPWTLVGWSMGGYIGADSMADPAAARRTRRLITFGTPFDGTDIARISRWLGLRINVRDFAPGSFMLARLRRLINDPARPWDFKAINGGDDSLAPGPLKTIPRDAALSGPYTHLSLVYDFGLFALIEGLVRESAG